MRIPLGIFLAASLFAFVPLAAGAAPAAPTALPHDVPTHHWAAGAVARIVHQRIMGRDLDGRFRGDKPVTRYELAVTLDRFVRYMEASHKPLHIEAHPPTVPFSGQAPPDARRALTHLVSQHFLPPSSPLLTRSGDQAVSADEFADALAAVTIRLSDRAEAVRKE